MAQYQLNGWTKVPEDLFPDFQVEQGGLVLMVRPMAITKKARQVEAQKARGPIADRERMLGAGGPGVPLPSGAGQHSSARQFNHIRRSMEQIEIPTGDE
jgi:hypothetical protein